MTDLDSADVATSRICEIYALLGSAAFLVRTVSDGSVRVLGPRLPAESVAKMLHSAADAYLAQAVKVTSN